MCKGFSVYECPQYIKLEGGRDREIGLGSNDHADWSFLQNANFHSQEETVLPSSDTNLRQKDLHTNG